MRHLFVVMLLFTLVSGRQALASGQIKVIGNERLSVGEILPYLDTKGLLSKRPAAVDRSLKNLYSSGICLDSEIYYDGNDVVVSIKENPIILDIKFVGNKKVKDEDLENELSLKKRSIFNRSKLEADVKRIQQIYLKSGRFLSRVDPEIVTKDKNRVEIIFNIFEGKRAKIKQIYFLGNKNVSDGDLAYEISTKRSQWYKFLSSADIYDADRIEFDKEKLRRFYNSIGYIDFEVISATSQLNKTRDGIYISFLLEEGVKYRVGKIEIDNKLKSFDATNLEKEIIFKEGAIYNAELVDQTIDRMIEILSRESYAFADIAPSLKKDQKTGIVDVSFVIKETPRIYVERINILGNSVTQDEVIRRELRFAEGDPYNINKINRSKQRIENLGYFSSVSLDIERVEFTNKVEVNIRVEEKKTGEMNLGVGYSTIDRLTTNAGIRERNLMGTGRDLSFNLQKSYSQISSDLSFTKPYFMDYPLNVGFDIFRYKLNKRNNLVYDQDSTGFSLRSSYWITEFLTHSLNYSYKDESVSNIDSNASISIKNLEGSYIVSKIGHNLFYDKRDRAYNTKRGFYLSLSQEYSGVGGNVKNIKSETSFVYYLPVITEDYIFKASLRAGAIKGIGQDVKSNFGFFLGGNSFRGFNYAGLGPRAKSPDGSFNNGDIIGGKYYYVASAEIQFPLGLPKEMGVSGVLFSDSGTVTGVDNVNNQGTKIADSGSLRSSYGFSIVWSSPMGPISLDFSRIAKKEEYDQSQSFRFSFGTTF